jgi:hypothetical protein
MYCGARCPDDQRGLVGAGTRGRSRCRPTSPLRPLEVHAPPRVVRQRRSPDLEDDIADPVLLLDPVARRRTAARSVPEDILAALRKDLHVPELGAGLLVGCRRVAEEARSQRVRGPARTSSARKPVIPLDVFVPHRSRGFRRLHLQILRRGARRSAPPAAGRRAPPPLRAPQPPPRRRPRSTSAARARARRAPPPRRRATRSAAGPG